MSDQDLQKIKDKEKAEQEKAAANSGSNSKPSSGSGSGSNSKSNSGSSSSTKQKTTPEEKSKLYKKCMKKAAPAVRDKICKIENPVERISKTARLLVGSGGSPKTIYKQAMTQSNSNVDDRGTYEGCQYRGESCNTFVVTVLRASGVDLGVPSASSRSGNATWVLENYFYNHPKKWKLVSHNPNKSKDGDVVVEGHNHVTLTVKKSNGKLVTAHASLCGFYPILSSGIYNGYDYPSVFRYIGD